MPEEAKVMDKHELNADNIIMYILINNDLNMKKGKIASQVGHVVGIITEEIIRKSLECPTKKYVRDYLLYNTWIQNGHAKIVLKASEKELQELIKTEDCRYIIDAGRTQIAPNSLTVVGFFPRDDLKEKMREFKLL